MTAGSPQRGLPEWFTAPEQVNQRRYEALRAFFVDGLTHAEAGARFGYTRWAMVNLVREHRAGRLQLFAPPRKPGPPPGTAPRNLSTWMRHPFWTITERQPPFGRAG
jgi:hypothetical protein